MEDNIKVREYNPIVVVIGLLYLMQITLTEAFGVQEHVARYCVVILFMTILVTGATVEALELPLPLSPTVCYSCAIGAATGLYVMTVSQY